MPICSKCGKTYNGTLCACEFVVDPGVGGGPMIPPELSLYMCNQCGKAFESAAAARGHICFPANKLCKEREDWFTTIYSSLNPNNVSAVSKRCINYYRIFKFITYGTGIKCDGGTLQPTTDKTIGDTTLSKILAKIPSSTQTITKSSSKYYANIATTSQGVPYPANGNLLQFTTENKTTTKYVLYNFNVTTSGDSFTVKNGAFYFTVVFELTKLNNNTVIAEIGRISRSGTTSSSYTLSASTVDVPAWCNKTIDLEPNTTYVVKAKFITGNPFDSKGKLYIQAASKIPFLKIFDMDKCPRWEDAFGVS